MGDVGLDCRLAILTVASSQTMSARLRRNHSARSDPLQHVSAQAIAGWSTASFNALTNVDEEPCLPCRGTQRNLTNVTLSLLVTLHGTQVAEYLPGGGP